MNRDILRENRVHGDSVFPLGVYHVACENESMILTCHWHEELELLMVNEGKATFQVGTEYYQVSAGEAIFINSGELHAGHAIENFKCSFSAVVFNPSMLYNNIYDPIQVKFVEPIMKKQYLLPVLICSKDAAGRRILQHINEIIEAEKNKPFTYELSVKASLLNIFSLMLLNPHLINHKETYPQSTYKVERIKKAMEFIYENYNKKICLKEIADELNMSEGHFCRFFKLMVNKTPVDFINFYRVNKAAKLLEVTSKKIIEIAIDAGFENVSYFTSTFKNYMRCTPSEYRKLKKEIV